MLARLASLLRPRAAMTESDIVQCQSGPVPSCAVPAAESSLITSTTRREKRKPDVANPSATIKRQKPCCSGDQTDICDNDDQENQQQPSSMLGASSGVEHPSRHNRSSLGAVLLTSIYWLQQGGQQPAVVQIGEQDSPVAVAQEEGQLQAEASASADASAECASPTSSSTPTVSQPSTAGQHSHHHTHSVSHQQFLQQEEELYHQQQVTSGASEDSEDLDYDEEDFDPFVFIAQLGPVEQYADPGRQPLLPRQTRTCKQKTLVLDLDETLVHSTLDAVCGVGADFTFPVMFNGAEHMVHVRQRPHMREFLEAVANDWEVVVFTASQKVYAEKLLNILDPQRQLIRHRIYRDSCVLVDGNYLKDLTVLGRDLSRCAIVDNSPQAFGFQVENGIPIESWYDDPEDTELLQLLPFLSELAGNEVPDVRPRIKRKFNLENKIRQAYQVAYTMHVHQTAAVALLQPQQLAVLQQMPQAQVQQA